MHIPARRGLTPNPRVLLAEDNPGILEELEELLASRFDVVGAVANGDLLLKAANTCAPEVIVVDISMPVLSGLDAVAELKKRGCKAKIVFLTIYEKQLYADACFSVGGDAFVAKSRLILDLIPAIQEVLAGGRFLSDVPA